LNIPSYKFSGYKSNNDIVKRQNIDNIHINKQQKLKKDSISFGAISYEQLIKAGNTISLEKAKMIRIDLYNSLNMSLGWVINNGHMSSNSWKKINEIMKRNSFDKNNPVVNNLKSLYASKEILLPERSITAKDMSKTSYIKWDVVENNLKKNGFELSLNNMEIMPVKRLVLTDKDNNILSFIYKDNDTLEIFYDKLSIYEELVMKNIDDIEDKSHIAEAINKEKQAIIMERKFIHIPTEIQNKFKLPNIESEVLEGIKITDKDLGPKSRKNVQDIKTIVNILLQEARIVNNNNVVSKNQKMYYDQFIFQSSK
jgi:hypothetical protein